MEYFVPKSVKFLPFYCCCCCCCGGGGGGGGSVQVYDSHDNHVINNQLIFASSASFC